MFYKIQNLQNFQIMQLVIKWFQKIVKNEDKWITTPEFK